MFPPSSLSGPNKKEDNSECRDLKKVKANVIKALENGLALRYVRVNFQGHCNFVDVVQHLLSRWLANFDF